MNSDRRSAAKDKDATLLSSLQQSLLHNFWLKLIALLCTLSLYAFIHSSQNAQRTVAVKLVAQNPSEKLKRELLTNLPGTVDVTMIGPRQQLDTIAAEDHSITLDLTAAQSSDLVLVPSMIADLPPRVRVDRIYPGRLDIRFEDIVSRAVPVEVTLEGEPAKGMEVQGEILMEPKAVTVVGIASEVETLQSIRAEPFQVRGLGEGSHTRKLKLASPPGHTRYNANVVTATVDIGKLLAQRNFDGLAIAVVGVTDAKLAPATVQVRVTGSPADIEALDAASISPRVRVGKEGEELPKSGSVEVLVELSLPGVQVEVVPSKVVVSW